MEYQTNGNLESFIGGNDNIMLVSDFEGYAPCGMIEKVKNHLDNDSNRLIFLGDVADYTFIGNILNHSQNGARKERFCYLQMLNLINTHSNAISVIGNRDINKLKLVPLLEIENNTNWWKSGENILEIAENLKKNINNGEWKWKITDLTSFYPYWNEKNPNISSWKGWKHDPSSLTNRFDAIFGQDPSVGTMSAQNTLYGLPIELGFYNEETKDDKELLSAIVFIAYARMLDILLYNPKYGFNTNIDGVLAHYLTTNPICGYLIKEKHIFLFSHGGFHSDYTGKYEILPSIFESIKSTKHQQGGQIETINSIDNFNTEFREKIKKVIHKEGDYSNDLDLLLALGVNVDEHSKINNMTKKSPIMPRHTDHLDDNKPLFSDNKISPENVYNIYGHSPNGFAYTFAIGKKGQRIVNCDFSNSLYKSYQYLDTDNYDQNNLVLYFNPMEQNTNKYFSLDGSLHLINSININSSQNEDIKKYFCHPYDPKLNCLYTSDNPTLIKIALTPNQKFTIEYNRTKSTINFSPETYNIKQIFSNKYSYHGIAEVTIENDENKVICQIYTIPGEAFNKTLALLEVPIPSQNINVKMGGKRKKSSKRNIKKSKKQSAKKIKRKISKKKYL